jgi:N-acetylglucosaminyl-diphospho-decaprenol L-rhamnosyltransferase
VTRVRIGIVSWNTAPLLDRCLAAIPKAAAGLNFDVVVVDNHSADESVQLAGRHAGVTVIANESNVGYARGMNQALMYESAPSSFDAFIALNSDTVPPQNSLSQLVKRLMDDPTLGLVAPRLVNEDGTLQHSVYRFPSSLIAFIIWAVPFPLQRGWLARKWWLDGRVPHDQPCDVDWAIGAVHVIRAKAVPEWPPYCERWFMYVEDMDLCWRLGQHGWRCRLQPEVEVMHVGNASGEQAWGETRTERWLEATYDWYRLRRGVAAARRWAFMNVVCVAVLLGRARAWRRILGVHAGTTTTIRITEMRQILPHHIAMMRSPRTAFVPPVQGGSE